MSIKKYAVIDQGKVRETNQDQAFVYTNNNMDTIGIVCDGMGGHKAGAYASLLTAKTILDLFIEVGPSSNDEEKPHYYSIWAEKYGWTSTDGKFTSATMAGQWLYEAMMHANNVVKEKSESDDKFSGMGTTLCISLICDDVILIGNVGDSRAYIALEDEFKLITEDQTWVNVLLKNKKISPQEALDHPKKHELLYAIGTMDQPQVDIYELDMANGTLLLCSDGIYNLVTESYLKTILDGTLPLSKKATTIVEEANSNGGYDNMSIVLIEISNYKASRDPLAIDDNFTEDYEQSNTNMIDITDLLEAKENE